jgi:hypothetical protein
MKGTCFRLILLKQSTFSVNPLRDARLRQTRQFILPTQKLPQKLKIVERDWHDHSLEHILMVPFIFWLSHFSGEKCIFWIFLIKPQSLLHVYWGHRTMCVQFNTLLLPSHLLYFQRMYQYTGNEQCTNEAFTSGLEKDRERLSGKHTGIQLQKNGPI